jgi:hypothetical protein
LSISDVIHVSNCLENSRRVFGCSYVFIYRQVSLVISWRS